MDRAVRFQRRRERAQSRLGIDQVVQHAGADDEIETSSQRRGSLDRPLLDVKVGQTVLALQLLGLLEAGGTDVDADDVRLRTTNGVLRRLPRTASGNKDVEVRTELAIRPDEMEFGTRAVGTTPLVARAIEVLDGRR